MLARLSGGPSDMMASSERRKLTEGIGIGEFSSKGDLFPLGQTLHESQGLWSELSLV